MAMTKRIERSLDRDWTKWRSAHEETGHAEYAALAIGKWPFKLQDWALKACRTLLEDEYVRTEDVRYALMAIGTAPNDPPDWAVQACRCYFLKFERSPKGYDPTNEMHLDEMARLIRSGEAKSAHDAALQVTGDELNGSNAHRLLRLWKEEFVPVNAADRGDGELIHPRVIHLIVREAKVKGNFMMGRWNPSLKKSSPNSEQK